MSRMRGPMKILVIVARQVEMQSYHLPVGIGYVSASLKRAGHDVVVLNPNHSVERFDVLVAREIEKHQPHVVFTGGMAFHLKQMQRVVALTRTLSPEAVIVLGGPLVTNQPQVAMTAVPEADFGVIGEGEHTTVELLAALETGNGFDKVKGIIYQAKGTQALRQTAPRPIEKNLDLLPWVDYEGLGLDVYASLHNPGECAPALVVDFETRVMPLITSRGCPYSCTFCCHEFEGRSYRARSLDDVFSEIKHNVERYAINALFIYDDLFCLQPERLKEFCARIAPLGLRWECSLHAGQVDAEILKLMKDSGCCCISVGVESMSPTILKSMNKQTTVEQLERVLSQIYDARIGVWANMIFGDPAETLGTVKETLEWFANNSQYIGRFAKMGYHPGSRIYDDAVKRGLIGDPVEYLLKEDCELNATTMTDEESQTMCMLMDRAFLSFGHAGRLIGVQQVGRDQHVAHCICPYCGAEGFCYDLGLGSSINCPSCNRAYRPPTFVRKKAPSEVARLLGSLREMEHSKASSEEIKSLCDRIFSLDTTNSEIWHSLIRLADAGDDGLSAISLLERAIVRDPYNRALFEQMTVRLTARGLGEASAKYARKAQHLSALGIDKTTFVDLP